jgi:hypothetical protein
MIWPKIPGIPRTGYNTADADTTIKPGMFMYIAGAVAATDLPVGTAGYSSAGDLKLALANHTTVSGNGAFPVNSLILQTENSDYALETIASGRGVIFYEGGEYETDQYNSTCSGLGVTPGTKLYLDGSGLISTSGTAVLIDSEGWGPSHMLPIAEFVSCSDYPATADWFNAGGTSKKKTVRYKLYPWHSGPMATGFA